MTDGHIRRLYFGDNLEIMREHVGTGSVDLVYLDPPFNSNQTYNVLFKGDDSRPSQAQIEAFDDTWHWTPETQAEYERLVTDSEVPTAVAKAIDAFKLLLGENDVMAYLVMMTPRLLEIHRVLKETGSMYLHCDPTASHYLKVICDQVFGPRNFRNEVVWKRTGAHGAARRWGPIHDVILFYTASDKYVWNPVYQPYSPEYEAKFDQDDERGRYMPISLTGPGTRTGESGQPWRGVDPTTVGRHWQPSSTAYEVYESLTGKGLAHLPLQERLDALDDAGLIAWPKKVGGTPRFKQYLQDMPGLPLQDIVTDIPPIAARAAERLGYPTQKPQALLERLIAVSTNSDALVLDPFCGCGTTIAAAEKLGRSWIGIDITYLAIALIEQRLEDQYPGIQYEEQGSPKDVAGAGALFGLSHKNFEMWAVRRAGGRPNPKGGGDKGTDGEIRFYIDKSKAGWVTISVKGGDSVNPSMVRDLIGTVEKDKSQMGILITRVPPSKQMLETAAKAGTYEWPVNGQKFAKVQIITIEELLAGKRPDMPPEHGTFQEAPRAVREADSGEQLTIE